MVFTATITSKRQITLPALLFSEFGFKKGEKVVLIQHEDGVIMKSSLNTMYSLKGVVKREKKYANMDVDEMIELAKRSHFGNRNT